MTPIEAAAFLALGAVAGTVFFVLLRWNTSLYAQGGVFWGVGLQVVRIAVLVAVLIPIARLGALPLLLTALGLLIVRPIVMRVMANRLA